MIGKDEEIYGSYTLAIVISKDMKDRKYAKVVRDKMGDEVLMIRCEKETTLYTGEN